MDQRPLYAAIREAGFQVVEFTDCPGSFGSWHVQVARGHSRLRLCFDGRDSDLALEQPSQDQGWNIIKHQQSPLSQDKLISLCQEWLSQSSRA